MKKRSLILLLCVLIVASFTGCNQKKETKKDATKTVTRNKQNMDQKKGVYYELFVRSYADSDGDGIGDFNGVTAHLDELKDLGIDGIWLMPIQPSPSYHGYDVTDYLTVNKEYGTEEDFKNLLTKAHEHGIKIIMDFVVNHTSSEHPWFVDAATNKDSQYKDFYNFIDKDSSRYDPKAKSPWGTTLWNLNKKQNNYYYAMFYEGMPDLNFDSKEVRKEIKAAAAKWLDLGVDGFRLDAAMHVYGKNESTKEEKLTSANVAWWNEFATACEKINPNVYLAGEVWSNEAVMEDYAQPLDTKFDFTFSDSLLKAVLLCDPMGNDGKPLAQTFENIKKKNESVDKNFIDGVFATNHDQDRVMTRLESVEKAKLLANVYLTVGGNPYIYYGEELGMYGASPDEMRRTPYIWSTNKKSEEYKSNTTWEEDTQNEETKSREDQVKDKNSIYSHYKELLKVRKASSALSSGEYSYYEVDNEKICAYIRESKDQKVLVLHNFDNTNQKVMVNNLKVKNCIYKSDEKTSEGPNPELAPYSTLILEVE